MPIFCTANIQSRQQKLGKRKLGGKPSGIFCRLGSVNISLRVQHTSTFPSQLYPSYFLIYLRSSYSCEACKGLENPTETAENDPIKKQVTTRGPIRSQRSWPRVSLSLTKTNAASDSVTRWGYFPPKWLFLASPGGENFGGAETAKSLNGGYFWTFLIFINKITK